VDPAKRTGEVAVDAARLCPRNLGRSHGLHRRRRTCGRSFIHPSTPAAAADEQQDARKCIVTIWNRQFDVVDYYRAKGFKVLPPDLTMQGVDLKRLGGALGDRQLVRQSDQKPIGDAETIIVQPGDDFDAIPPAHY
jgi:hypothetical protein